MPPDLDELLALGREAARRAGALLLDHLAAPPRAVRTKAGPRDLVSAADHAAEDAIRELLAAKRPGDGVLGEEQEETPSRTGLRWVVDPLDGTTNFLRRVPHWSVSVACEDADGGLVGVVHDPLRGEWFTGARRRGAALGDAPLRGSQVTDLGLALVCGEFTARSAAQAACSTRVLSAAGYARAYGSAALDLAWAAAGRVDAAFHVRHPSRWDVAAGAVLCHEAGMTVERLHGADGEAFLVAAPPALGGPLRAAVLS